MPFLGNAENYSFQVFGGYNHVFIKQSSNLKVKVSDGEILGANFSLKLSQFLQTELETSYRSNKVRSQMVKGGESQFLVPLHGTLKSVSIFANFICCSSCPYFIQPYAGIGIGGTCEYAEWSVALIENNTWYDFSEGSRGAISYQIIGGFRLPAQDKIRCGLEFRVLNAMLHHTVCRNHSIVFLARKEF